MAKFACRICGKGFQSETAVRSHEADKHGDRDWKRCFYFGQRGSARASTPLIVWCGCVLLLPSGYGCLEIFLLVVAHPTLALCVCFAALSMRWRSLQRSQGTCLTYTSRLQSARLGIVPNNAEGECWWLASQRWHGMTPEAGRQACASMPCHDPKVRRALQAPGSWQNPTDTQQIKHAVDVLERFCRQGLVVVYADHREVAGVWFQAGCPPTKVAADVAQQLARQEGGPHFMLYTKGHGATPGHFEDLIAKQAHATHKATGSRMSGFAVHVPVFVGGMESETPNPRPRQRFKLADFQPVIDVEALSVESDLQAAQAEPPLPPVAAMPSSWSGSAQPLSNWEAHATLPQPWLQRLRKRDPTSTDPRADAAPMQVPPLRPSDAAKLGLARSFAAP